MFWFGKKHRQKDDAEKPLPFFEIEVAPNEMWTIWNKPRMPLVFPTHTFSRFVQMVSSDTDATTYRSLSLRSYIKPGLSTDEDSKFLSILEAVDIWLERWRDETLDRFVSLPTFGFFGNDAVKALRAATLAPMRREGRHPAVWREVPADYKTQGTLLYRGADASVFIAHDRVKCVIGSAWRAKAYLDNSVFDTQSGSYTRLSGDELAGLVRKPPFAEFAIMLMRNFIDGCEIDQSDQWALLTTKFIPAQLKYTGTAMTNPPPTIDHRASPSMFRSQLKSLLDWAYFTGLLCPIYTFIDGHLGSPINGKWAPEYSIEH